MKRTSSGVDLHKMLKSMALTPIDLPDPVVPATRRWGILAISVTTVEPPISLPKAKVRGERDSWKLGDAITSFNCTISRCSFGISIPTTDFPGMTSTMRTLMTASDLARSFARLLIFCTLTPAAGCSSKRVITGPGKTLTTSASTPKSASLSSNWRDIASSEAWE